ncbi:hypothetical protein ILUMI_20331 [Ignelater luminosus]|uniref:PiggyBac transposable element-derived protein domain-containing protein n=1 Tax=Ignelater luminosus TaxID=2038154 RepID=A0A8K0CIE2_IGNLU|nr:hypothetical protein ILUMI_20331 [Ignelater luminosus]
MHAADSTSYETVPSTSTSKGRHNKKFKKSCAPHWERKQPNYTASPISEEFGDLQNIKEYVGGKSPLEVFLLYFDDEVLKLIVDLSMKYAADNNRHDFVFNKTMLKRFIGVLVLTGYHTLPQIELYWSRDGDKGVQYVTDCMSRNMFRNIKKNIYLADNSSLDTVSNNQFEKHAV